MYSIGKRTSIIYGNYLYRIPSTTVNPLIFADTISLQFKNHIDVVR